MPSLIKTIIIDDEDLLRNTLELLVEKYCPHVQMLRTFKYVDNALEYMKRNELDLIFLDFYLSYEGSVQSIVDYAVNNSIKIIWVTGYADLVKKKYANNQEILDTPVSIRKLIEILNKNFD